MIELLQPNTPNQSSWLEPLKQRLHRYAHLFTIHTDLIVDKILRNEYAVFSVNDELTVIGFVYNSGVDRIFFIYWIDGLNINKNIQEMMDYAVNNLSCVSAELKSNTSAHHRLYRRILQSYKVQESLLFRVAL